MRRFAEASTADHDEHALFPRVSGGGMLKQIQLSALPRTHCARVPRFHGSKTGNAGGKFSPGERLKAAVN